jgi:hypothetical protein
MSLGLDPSSLASLLGTISPEGLLSQQQAMNQQQQEELARQAASAQQSAGQAQQAYQQAAGASTEANPMDSFISNLFAEVASQLEGNQGPNQRNQANQEASRGMLLKARADNLSALRDIYGQKAEEAQKAGDLATTEKYRRQYETLSKQHELVSENAKRAQDNEAKTQFEQLQQENRIALEKLRTSGDLKIKQAAPGTAAGTIAEGANPEDYVESSESGIKYVNIDPKKVPDLKLRGALSAWARKNKYVVIADREKNALDLVAEARSNTQGISDRIMSLLPTSPGDRFFGTGPRNALADLTQSVPEIRAYRAYRTSAIQIIQAIAGLGKGLRINQAEINAALKFDMPEITDTQDVAREKLAILNEMLDHVERAALGQKVSDAEMNRVIRARPGQDPAPTGTKGSGSAPGSRSGALQAANTGNREEFMRIISANPGLDSDPMLMAKARKAGWLNKVVP